MTKFSIQKLHKIYNEYYYKEEIYKIRSRTAHDNRNNSGDNSERFKMSETKSGRAAESRMSNRIDLMYKLIKGIENEVLGKM